MDTPGQEAVAPQSLLREHVWMCVLPKKTQPVQDMTELLQGCIRKTFGAAEAEKCSASIQEMAKDRKVIEEVSEIDSIDELYDKSQDGFHASLDTQIAKAHVSYSVALEHFREKTKGTGAEMGVDTLVFRWDHWLGSRASQGIDTEQTLIEQASVLWNLGALYSMAGCVSSLDLRKQCRILSRGATGGHEDAWEETYATLSPRVKYFRSSALVFSKLRDLLVENKKVVDELDPAVCTVIIELMLAQAQEAYFMGYSLKYPSVAQKHDCAALAKAALGRYWKAIEAQRELGTECPASSISSLPQEAQLPTECAQHLMLCYTIMRIAVVNSILAIEESKKSGEGPDMGACIGYTTKLCRIAREYLYDEIRIHELRNNEVVSPYCRARMIQSKLTRVEGQRAAFVARNAATFRCVVPSDDQVDAVFDEIAPNDQTSVAPEAIRSISAPLKWLVFEASVTPFDCIVSRAANDLWTAYRIAFLQQFRIQRKAVEQARAELLDLMEPFERGTVVAKEEFPLLHLYFIAHSLGITRECVAPPDTPLASAYLSSSEPPTVLEGAMNSWNTLLASAASSGRYASLAQAAAEVTQVTSAEIVKFSTKKASAICAEFEFFSRENSDFTRTYQSLLPQVRDIISKRSVRHAAGIGEHIYTYLENHTNRVVPQPRAVQREPVPQTPAPGAPDSGPSSKPAQPTGWLAMFAKPPAETLGKASARGEASSLPVAYGSVPAILSQVMSIIVDMIDSDLLAIDAIEEEMYLKIMSKLYDVLGKEVIGASNREASSFVMDQSKWLRDGCTASSDRIASLTKNIARLKEIMPTVDVIRAELAALGYSRTMLPNSATDKPNYSSRLRAMVALKDAKKSYLLGAKVLAYLEREADVSIAQARDFVKRHRQIAENARAIAERYSRERERSHYSAVTGTPARTLNGRGKAAAPSHLDDAELSEEPVDYRAADPGPVRMLSNRQRKAL